MVSILQSRGSMSTYLLAARRLTGNQRKICRSLFGSAARVFGRRHITTTGFVTRTMPDDGQTACT
jgi:hypothetical protein